MLLIIGMVTGIKVHCKVDIRDYMHASGILTEFLVSGKISDINLISHASSEHVPQYDCGYNYGCWNSSDSQAATSIIAITR